MGGGQPPLPFHLIKNKINNMTKTLYVVQYNDCYGNGYNKKLETIVESQEQFIEWLKRHNEERRNEYLEDDYLEESAEEFNLIPLQLFN